MMKKMPILMVLAMVIMSFSAFAQFPCFPPYPVFGKVTLFGFPAGHVVLTINSAVVEESDVNQHGEYSFDLANLPNCYHFGDAGRISVCNDQPSCNFDFAVSNAGKVRRDFLIVSSPPVETPSSTNVVVSGGGGGGGGGGSVPLWQCEAWTPCVNGQQSRTCLQPAFNVKRSETRNCEETPIVSVPETIPTILPETPPVTPPVSPPPEPEPLRCSDGTIVSNLNDCLETPEQVKGYGKTVGVTIGSAFAALIAYWVYKRHQRSRAKKMADTYIKKHK